MSKKIKNLFWFLEIFVGDRRDLRILWDNKNMFGQQQTKKLGHFTNIAQKFSG